MPALHVSVIGCGHVGSVVSACLADDGHSVVGLDSSLETVDRLRHAQSPFFEPGLEESLARGLSSGRLRFDSREGSVDGSDVFVVCVDTPLTDTGADLSKLHSVLRTVARSLVRTGRIVPVILKSTTPPGVANRLAAELAAWATAEVPVAVVPEFLRQGVAVADFRCPQRVVIGSGSDSARQAARTLFGRPNVPVLETDTTTAEFIKHGANAFLAARVSLINELADLASAYGCDVDTVAAGIGLDSRIGRQFLSPGIGFGGSCLPRDVSTLIASARNVGLESRLLEAVLRVNEDRVERVVESLKSRLGSLSGARLAVWGLTFKGGTEDTRLSPALPVIASLKQEGARVSAYDPAARHELIAELGVTVARDPFEACAGADALLLLSDWPEFAQVALNKVRETMRGTFVFDGRNALDATAVRAAGLDYEGVGRPNRRSTNDS